MMVNIKTSVDKNREGMCPECHEWTSVPESCCGAGAHIEGGLVSDESAQEDLEFPTACVELLKNVPESKARVVKAVLFEAGISCSMFGRIQGDSWNVNIFIPLNSIIQNKE